MVMYPQRSFGFDLPKSTEKSMIGFGSQYCRNLKPFWLTILPVLRKNPFESLEVRVYGTGYLFYICLVFLTQFHKTF
jgi:hypothetical protein